MRREPNSTRRCEACGTPTYIVGSSLVTVGLAESNPTGFARWIVLGAGFCGLAVMTMAVTYLLEVQGSVGPERDIGIIKLNTSAGEPPSAVALLRAIRGPSVTGEGCRGPPRKARDWCATVRQSHSNHPSLIYFQSVEHRVRLASGARRSAGSRTAERAVHRRRHPSGTRIVDAQGKEPEWRASSPS